jgi:hypothetical protein
MTTIEISMPLPVSQSHLGCSSSRSTGGGIENSKRDDYE